FQAEDGIRDFHVTGVQTCALPIYDYGGQYASSPPLMPSGERVDTPHLSWTSEPYRENTLTNFELVASRHRYHTPLSRSIFLGAEIGRASCRERVYREGVGMRAKH